MTHTSHTAHYTWCTQSYMHTPPQTHTHIGHIPSHNHMHSHTSHTTHYTPCKPYMCTHTHIHTHYTHTDLHSTAISMCVQSYITYPHTILSTHTHTYYFLHTTHTHTLRSYTMAQFPYQYSFFFFDPGHCPSHLP